MSILAIAAILGCIHVKNKIAKLLLGILGGILLILLWLWLLVVYSMNYATADVDTKTSDDGTYSVIMKSVGSPLFFSPADGRFVLKEGKKTIVKYNFTVYDDGAGIRPSIWNVEWQSDSVRIIVSGSEQSDHQYELYFDGHVEDTQLDTIYGKSIEEYNSVSGSSNDVNDDSSALIKPDENETEQELDADGYPLTDEFQSYKQQMAAISEFITKQELMLGVASGVTDFQCEYFLSAKGYPYAVIYRDTEDLDGSSVHVEQRLVYNESYEADGKQEYVYEEIYFDENGNEAQSAKILDFFLIDTESLDITEENRTKW
jgi:hypothetical protein